MNTPSNAGKEHDVKCWLEFYEAVESGEKPFEIRLNDRDYQVGDTLLIREYNPYGQNYTGRSCRRLVTYMTDWEQKPGRVVLGLRTPPTQEGADIDSQISECAAEQFVGTFCAPAQLCRDLSAKLTTAQRENDRLRSEVALIEWQNQEKLTVTWNHLHGAFIVQGVNQVVGNMGRGPTVIEALRAARAATEEGKRG